MAKLYCLMGLPGAGKSTVLYRLHNDCENVIFVPRITDRTVRPDELPPDENPEYCFESRKWFKFHLRSKAFASVENLGNYHYAVREDDIKRVLGDGQPGIVMAGYCGLELQDKFLGRVETIFLTVPGIDLQKSHILPNGATDLALRMRSRGDSEIRVKERLELAQRIIEVDKVHLRSSHIIVNEIEKLESTVKNVRKIIFH